MSGYPHNNPSGYGAPPSSQPYGAPAQPYGAPTQPYGAPAQPYGAPAQPYGAPAQPYGAPQPSAPYGAPPQTKPPKDHHTPSSSPYGAPQHGGGYPTGQGPYGSPFAALVPSTFPPGTDNSVIACFQVADQDGSGIIDDKELQRALSSYNQSFSIRTVHLLMYLFTNTNTRKIGPKEFTQVFYSLQSWRANFEKFDRDRSGKIDTNELREALMSLGFAVSPVVLDLLVSKFDKTGGKNKAIEYVTIPNQQLLAIAQSNTTAANWVSRNILPYISTTNITAISVGNEVFTTTPNTAPVLVSALKYIHSALITFGLDSQIKVSTAHSSSIILDSFPPSQAFFNRTLEPFIIPLLEFLQSTGSYLMLNVYPYYDYTRSNGAIPLDYALFRPLTPDKEAIDLNTLLHYTNVFDAVVDAAYFAMTYLNYTNIPVVVTESGWPSKGDPSEPDANADNANTYNSNLIKHVLNNTGTPKHPGVATSTYIYELYNEDLKAGPTSEKNWGLFNPDGSPVYVLHLTDSGSVLSNDTTDRTFCVAKDGADVKMLQAALDWACGPGKVNCSMMLQGQPCYEPDTVAAHATYAFNAYYHRMGMADGSCDFNGVATVTTTDPSRGDCTFLESGGSNGTFTNGTSMAPSTNSTTSGSSSLCNSVLFSDLAQVLVLFAGFL